MSRLPPFPLQVTAAELDWRDGIPVARAVDDIYFSRDGGIAETRHVFVAGNDLPARFAAGGFHHFTIAETGFGTGLNFLVAAREFLALAPPATVLHFVSVEKFPLTPADLARAHAHWPGLGELAAELAAVLPPATAGFHHRALAGGRIRLTLLLGDAAELLPRLDARVDAWFLDGFAPRKDGGLWTATLYAEFARLCAPGATFATFTAVGDVRRGLQAAGFDVAKAPGFGSKRAMLRGRLRAPDGNAGAIPAHGLPPPVRRAAVIGGGLAGCACAHALAARGWQVTLFERNAQLADETSGNLAGALYPKFSRHETAQNRWYRDSYLYAAHRLPRVLGEPDGSNWANCGLLQLPVGADNGAALAASGRWPAAIITRLEQPAASAVAGMEMPSGGLWFSGAAWVNPPSLCRALASHANISLRTGIAIGSIDSSTPTPCIDGEHYDAVVIANAAQAAQFSQAAWLPLRRVRGQVSHVAATAASSALRSVVCHDGYVTPARQGTHCIGATFGPRDRDPDVRASDHAENLAGLAAACPSLYDALAGDACRVTGGRTGFRTQTPDYLPLVGALADADAWAALPAGSTPPAHNGLYVLAALGAKGIAFALLGAEIIAANAGREPVPVDSEVAEALDPARFLVRARRRESR